MPRDANGIYTLAPGNPVLSGTTIETDWANPTMADIATALSDSLSRTGQGGMLAPFKNTDGSKLAPGISWSNEPTSGWYRKALQEFWYSVGNEDIFQITKTGVALAPGKIAVNFGSSVEENTEVPSNFEKGDLWFESDTGNLYVQYKNPDLTLSIVGLNSTGGPFIVDDDLGVANGVATLDSNGFLTQSQAPPPVNYIAGFSWYINAIDSVGFGPVSAPQGVTTGKLTGLKIVLPSMIKILDQPWSQGDDAGMLDTGVIADGDYYLFAILRQVQTSPGVFTYTTDYLASLSLAAPVLPSNFNADYRLVAWVERKGGVITPFSVIDTGHAIEFYWNTPELEVDTALAANVSREDNMRAPLNIPVRVHVNVRATAITGPWVILLSNTNVLDLPVSTDGSIPLGQISGQANDIVYNSASISGFSATIRSRSSVAIASYKVSTTGFTWDISAPYF